MLDAEWLIIDIHAAPLDVQEQAFDQGMIPFVPGRIRWMAGMLSKTRQTIPPFWVSCFLGNGQ
jgi:hypothetical protein